MMNRILWHVTGCATALMLFPTSSGAQTPAASFDELRGVLQDGDEVFVTGADGRRTQGKLLTVTPSSLELAVKKRRLLFLLQEVQQSFANTDVTTVQRLDSGREGAGIGFAAVFIPILIVGCIEDDPVLGCGGAAIGGALWGLVGAVIGRAIDRMHNATVYRAGTPASGGTTVSLSPLLTPRATGALLNVRF
jgi:hypothetical protein